MRQVSLNTLQQISGLSEAGGSTFFCFAAQRLVWRAGPPREGEECICPLVVEAMQVKCLGAGPSEGAALLLGIYLPISTSYAIPEPR